jgi:DNA-binding transcriptional MerR regulator
VAKTSEAFRSISEVSDGLGVPKHVLRFWEAKFPQIKPMKRGGGRRFYRPEDLELLRGIRQLLHHAGYTIKGVQKILREQGPDAVKVMGREAALAGKAKAAPFTSNAVTSPPAPRGRPRGSAAALGERRTLIKAMIVELEACQVMLERAPSSTAVVATRKAS